MRREKIDNAIEKKMLIGMIMSSPFLRDVKEVYDSELVEIPFVDLVSEWCFEYYDEYKKSPELHIKDIFYQKASKGLDEVLSEQIEDFLAVLSEEYDEKGFNSTYILQKTKERFKLQSFKYLAEDIQTDIERGEDPSVRLREYKAPIESRNDWVDPFKDMKVIEQAYAARKEPLVRFPGALGQLWNSEFVRGAFVDICGPEKRGKSWILMLISMRCSRLRHDVAMFQVGDMSQNQMARRMAIYLTGRSDRPKYCGEVLIPIPDCALNQKNECEKSERVGAGEINWHMGPALAVYKEHEYHEPCTECIGSRDFVPTTWYRLTHVDPLSLKDAKKAVGRWGRWRGKSSFRMSTHSNDSVSVAHIEDMLDAWKEEDGFEPAMVVADYADIMAPMPGSKEHRHQVNDTWKALRRLGQERDCCIVTATQADAGSYDQRSVGLKNYSEDKRKRSHVTAEYGLNQTPSEKQRHIMRIGPIVVREEGFDTRREVHIIQSLETGRPFLDSWF